jgi:hypothetical protein
MISASAASANAMYICERLNISMVDPPRTGQWGNEGATALAAMGCVRFAALHVLAARAQRQHARNCKQNDD